MTKFAAMLQGLTQQERQGAMRAVAAYGGPGRTVTILPEGHLCDYLFALKLKRQDRRALFGCGPKKGPPMRRTYIIPRVARLVLDHGDTLVALMERAITAALDDAHKHGALAGKSKASPKKKALKRMLEEREAALCEAKAAGTRQKRRADKALSWAWLDYYCYVHGPAARGVEAPMVSIDPRRLGVVRPGGSTNSLIREHRKKQSRDSRSGRQR